MVTSTRQAHYNQPGTYFHRIARCLSLNYQKQRKPLQKWLIARQSVPTFLLMIYLIILAVITFGVGMASSIGAYFKSKTVVVPMVDAKTLTESVATSETLIAVAASSKNAIN